jgi:DUF2946 family protein
MRLRKLRRQGWAAWLGMLALGLNVLVPIHLAFDLAAAYGAAPERHLTAEAGGDRQSGDPADREDGHHRPDCPVCSALGSLAGLAPAAAPTFAAPLRFATAIVVAATAGPHDAVRVAAYRSRAPPFS